MENGERPMASAMVGRAVLRMVELNICMKKAAAVIMGSPVNMSREVIIRNPWLYGSLPGRSRSSRRPVADVRGAAADDAVRCGDGVFSGNESPARRPGTKVPTIYVPGEMFSPSAAGALLPLPLAEEKSSARMVSR